MQSPHSIRLEISIDGQRLRAIRDAGVVREYHISSSSRGTGFAEGSFRTPTGRFEIAGKIGANEPLGTIFVGRQAAGLWQPGDASAADLILTRILRLRGLDPENANSFDRYIYIHGTNHEELLGTPASHGCIRMANADVAELFELVEVGTPLVIHPPSAAR